MEKDGLLRFSNVRQRVASCFVLSNFSPHLSRSLVMGALISITMAEATIFILVRQSIKGGDLPDYLTDLLIGILSFIEAIMAPFISWLGYKNRRNTIIFWHLITSVFILILVVPGVNVNIGTEFCSQSNLPLILKPVTTKVVFRVAILIVIAMPFILTRLGIWAHGLAQIDDHKPEQMAQHFGILVAVRTIALISAAKMIGSLVESTPWVKVIAVLVGMAVNLVQLFRFPADVDLEVKDKIASEGRGFTESLGRVIRNKLALSQMVAMSLLAAALWGFASHENDIVKEKYNIHISDNIVTKYTEVLRFHIIIIMILFFAITYSPPVMARFEKLKAVKFGATLSLMLTALYIGVVLFFCTKGQVAGLQGEKYDQPACSLNCGSCSPISNKLSPVCEVEKMTTYLSPCHAGCGGMQEIGGIQLYANCTCTTFGRATVGACFERSCNEVLQIHLLVYAVIITITVVALQMQGMTLLRAVDPRDKSVALGLAGSFVAVTAFIFGHVSYVIIRRTTCAWYEGYHCNLHTPTFSYLIGFTSAAFALLASIVSYTTWFLRRRNEKQDIIDNDEYDSD